MRRQLLFLVCILGSGFPASGVVRAEAIFEDLSKDFGSVPRGTTLTHNFTLNNPTKSPLHISGIRTSCTNCMSAAVGQVDVPPGESTVLAVTIDTRKFSGDRKFTCHVQFDKPVFMEAQVLIMANSRDDITLTPGQLAFGKIKKGSGPSADVTIDHRGPGNWQITGVHNENGYLLPQLKENSRVNGQVVYQLSVKLRDDIPVGVWHADVWLKTNDAATPRIRVPLSVEVEGLLTATPAEVVLGRVKPGSKTERRVVIRAAAPFKVLSVTGVDDRFTVRPDNDDSKTVHVLNVTFVAGNELGERGERGDRGERGERGELARRFQVRTDLRDEPTVEFTVRAQVGP